MVNHRRGHDALPDVQEAVATAPGPFPPVFLPIKAVVAKRRFIAGVLAWCGVPRRVLPEHCIEVLSAVARGETVRDFARERGMGEGAAWFRFRLGRAELAALLAGRRWR